MNWRVPGHEVNQIRLRRLPYGLDMGRSQARRSVSIAHGSASGAAIRDSSHCTARPDTSAREKTMPYSSCSSSPKQASWGLNSSNSRWASLGHAPMPSRQWVCSTVVMCRKFSTGRAQTGMADGTGTSSPVASAVVTVTAQDVDGSERSGCGGGTY